MSPGVEMVIIFYLTGKITLFFSVYIPNSKNGIIFYLIGKKYMFFSGGLPQPRIPFEQTMSFSLSPSPSPGVQHLAEGEPRTAWQFNARAHVLPYLISG